MFVFVIIVSFFSKCICTCLIYRYFRNIQRNLHVFLLLPLIKNDADRSDRHEVLSAHIKKALRLCHCVEIYSPWTSQALVEIACHQLKKQYPQNADSEGKCVLSHLQCPVICSSCVKCFMSHVSPILISFLFSTVDRDSLITSLSWAMACIHQTAITYSANYLPGIQPFTSQTYIELIANYLRLCCHMWNQCQGHTNR